MVNYGIEPTFSNDESVEYPPPPPDDYSAPYADEAAYVDDAGYSVEPGYLDDAGHSVEPGYSAEPGYVDEPNDLSFHEDEFEHTLSEHKLKAEPYKDEVDEEELNSVSDIEFVESAKREHVSKKALLGSLTLLLLVIVAALGAALAAKNRQVNEQSAAAAIAEANAALIAPTLAPAKASTRRPTKSPVRAPTMAPAKNSESECKSVLDVMCETSGLETVCDLFKSSCGISDFDDICGAITSTDGGAFTVFAPRNEAFDRISERTQNILEDRSVLNEVLLSHVVGRKIVEEELYCGNTVHMESTYPTRTICSYNDVYQVGQGNSRSAFPKITEYDLSTCNGVLHVVDNLIMPIAYHHRPDMYPVSTPSRKVPTAAPNHKMPSRFEPTSQHHGTSGKDRLPMKPIRDKVLIDNTQPSFPDGFCEDKIEVSKSCYTFGESIEITYQTCSPGKEDWFGVFRSHSHNTETKQMRTRPMYWEWACGGNGETSSCGDQHPRWGKLTIDQPLGGGRYSVYTFSDVARPYTSVSYTESFHVARYCPTNHGSSSNKKYYREGKSL